ncbi:MAG TPA: hypothetical protein VJT50_03190 [Pyrinomonadaceae bacterium]|nr:hypothetical protein [Pyrinomonadaceae bacterium]
MDVLKYLFPIAIFVFFLLLVIGLTVYRNKRERARTEQLKSACTMLGWQFTENAPFNWIPNLEKFPLFNTGHSKNIRNMMYGEIEGVKAALFDYQYVTGSGKNRATFNQSVVYFEPRDLNLPFFSLRPENVLHKFISALGYQDIDFGQRPLFSGQYLLRGSDEQAIRNTFNDAILSFYEANLGTSTDGGGNQLFIFRASKRTEPLQSQAFINGALPLYKLFAHRW